MKKITLATIKSFVRKNKDNIFIANLSSFDGMTDCVQQSDNKAFVKATYEEFCENTLGVSGAWFVRGSRDYFTQYEDSEFEGYVVFNCCGSFILAIKKTNKAA